MKRYMLIGRIVLLAAIGLSSHQMPAYAQEPVIEMSTLDGVDITPDNIFNFQIQSFAPAAEEVTIRGSLRYRNSDLRIDYEFGTKLQPGMNAFNRDKVHTSLRYSSGALRELFEQHRMLPFGTYQYCITVSPAAGEYHSRMTPECIYRQSEDQFMITLVEPENKAKIYEYNPLLSWLATYSFQGSLTYRIRVAEIRDGQQTASAIARNNPVYEERNLTGNSIVYPVYAKPLKVHQPYAWTVDAYYKGILLGGAEPWMFTIVEDSSLADVPREQSFYEFAGHDGDTRLYAVGELKLKYVSELPQDMLSFRLTDADNKEISLPEKQIPLKTGDNRIVIPLKEKVNLGHKKRYTLQITTADHRVFKVPFIYINPAYLN